MSEFLIGLVIGVLITSLFLGLLIVSARVKTE